MENILKISRQDVERAYRKGVYPKCDEFALKSGKEGDELQFFLLGKPVGSNEFVMIHQVLSKKKLHQMTGE